MTNLFWKTQNAALFIQQNQASLRPRNAILDSSEPSRKKRRAGVPPAAPRDLVQAVNVQAGSANRQWRIDGVGCASVTWRWHAVASGNDDDREMDRGAIADGDWDAPQPPAILTPAQNIAMKCENTTLLGTDPFTIHLRCD